MAGVATGPDVKDLISGRALGQTRPNVKRMVFRGAAVIAGLVAVAVLTLVLMVQNREEELVAGVQQRVEITATARAEVFATWLEGVAQLATRLTESDLFRLFAAEVGLEGGSTALSRPLRDQLPYMQVAVTDFAEQSDIAGAYLIGPNGQAYLANASAPSLIPSQRSAAQAVYETSRRTVLPLRATENGLALDICLGPGGDGDVPLEDQHTRHHDHHHGKRGHQDQHDDFERLLCPVTESVGRGIRHGAARASPVE